MAAVRKRRHVPAPDQQRFAFEHEGPGFGVTFRDNGTLPVHGWYPYVEGFSAKYVQETLDRFAPSAVAVFDPFGGVGTTQLTCSMLGVRSYYCELNPFMAFVAEAKVTSASWARRNLEKTRSVFESFLTKLNRDRIKDSSIQSAFEAYHAAFPSRDFFELEYLRELLWAKHLAGELAQASKHLYSLLLVACAANVVGSSNMTRRADLRRRRADEYKNRIINVRASISDSVRTMLRDIESLPTRMAQTKLVSVDSRHVPNDFDEQFDAALTSPPYLNGTNYFRNTKLELWFLGFIGSEDELSQFRTKAVCGGINDVTGPRIEPTQFDTVEYVASQLDESATDKRIPRMVRYYFSDMAEVLAATYKLLRPGAPLVLDIGDSCFYGVHVPTDELLVDVAKTVGLEAEQTQTIAKRYSKTDKQLRQVEIVFRKNVLHPNRTGGKPVPKDLQQKIKRFGQQLPYLAEPFSRRNWGHALHSLCSYQGKLKPGIAHWLIRLFVPSGGSVIDPLGGVGTIAFEASLQGRPSISNDKSPFASLIGRAKLNPPSIQEALEALDGFERQLGKTRVREIDRKAAEFGLNATVAEYYHPDTLNEVLKARRMLAETPPRNRAEAFVWAALLHILHGNRPYALSRRSHPITPFKPTGPAQYKSVVDGIRARINRALSAPLTPEFVIGEGLTGDFRDLPAKMPGTFDAVITSPPFAGMRFDRPNWLRLWFCGWGEQSFHEESKTYLERQQAKSMGCYADFFESCRKLLKRDGLLIIHMGGSDRDPLPAKLCNLGEREFHLLADVAEDVERVEKHGLKDKGRTTRHHFLFFERN